MILGSDVELAVGKRVVGAVTDGDSRIHRGQPLVVLRESTYAEWVEQVHAHGLMLGPADYQRGYYYEVSVD